VETDGGSLIIEKRGTPRAILLSIRDYVRLAAPEPEVLKLIGVEAKRNGTSNLSERQIDKIIRANRARNSKRRKSPVADSDPSAPAQCSLFASSSTPT
jgi:hypothetical protein